MRATTLLCLLCLEVLGVSLAWSRPRARELGVPFDGTPGPLNAITDVRGVEVGHATVIQGAGVRTGVTAILPRGRGSDDPVFAGWFPLNGNGELTGTAYLDEFGALETPVLLTGTHSVGVVRDAVIAYKVRGGRPDPTGYWWSLPVVGETYDGYLHDANGFHVRPAHVFAALDGARGGPVAEGSVGGGTGMVCHEWKGGIGTASRVVTTPPGRYTIGVLVQCNYGRRAQLRVAGVPVGRELPGTPLQPREHGSILIIVATDAPLLPHQLKRLARRAALGLARDGSIAGDGSGDLMLAFSTANPGAYQPAGVAQVAMLGAAAMDPIFSGVIEATEEAIINALVAAEPMTGYKGRHVPALPTDRLREILRRYGRLQTP